MKIIVSILLLAAGFAAQAKTAEINCQAKVYSCINDGRGMTCDWVLLRGLPIGRVELEETNVGAWIGTYSSEFDGHRLQLNIRQKEIVDQDGNPAWVQTTQAELWTPQVSASSSGSNRIDIGLHNMNYGRGFFCRSIKVVN